MLEKVFGKKNSIQRSVFKYFIISVVGVIIIALIGFFVFVDNETAKTLVEINVKTEEEAKELIGIIRRSIAIVVFSTLLVSVIIIRIINRKIMKPISQLNEATKQVAKGDFSIKLETVRNDEIGELTNNFNKMVEDLGSIEHLQKDFINNMSHEIKTPITSIQGFATLLSKDDVSTKERKEYSNIIKEESNRLLNMSTNILKLSKLQNQNEIINKTQINIAEQLRKAIVLLEPKWSKKEIIFNVCLEEKYFLGDEDLIFQVWVNLIDNAIKFSNQNGSIDIILEEKEDYLQVQIKDNGIGIKKEEQERIFTKFYQIDKSHSTHGSGLGLAIVKGILDLSNGTIEVESQKDVGTNMIVKLPIEEENNKIVIE